MQEWIIGWGYECTDFSMFPLYAENETQRLWFLNNVFSSKIRIRLSNKFNKYPVKVDKVSIGIADASGRLIRESICLTCEGECGFSLQPGECKYSDECEFSVFPGQWVSVSIYIKEKTKIVSATSSQSNVITRMSCRKGGDFCCAESVSGSRFLGDASEFIFLKPLYNVVCALVDQVEFQSCNSVFSLALFGDSITQHGHWGEALTKRLYDAFPGRVTVFNRGICGNKILHDASIRTGFGMYFGINAIERFTDDVYGGKKVDAVIVQEGVNDIINPDDGMCARYETICASDLIKGYQRIIEIAKSNSSSIFGCTIMPFKGFRSVWSEKNEKTREEVNYAIRSAGIGFDAYFDFDQVIVDPVDKTRSKESLSIDCLHPNKDGGVLLAESIDFTCLHI